MKEGWFFTVFIFESWTSIIYITISFLKEKALNELINQI